MPTPAVSVHLPVWVTVICRELPVGGLTRYQTSERAVTVPPATPRVKATPLYVTPVMGISASVLSETPTNTAKIVAPTSQV